MLISNDTESLKRARFLATQSRDPAPHYQHSEKGYNYRLSNILAGIGRGQMEVLDERVRARRLIFSQYYQELSHLPGLQFMPELENTFSNRWLTALTIDEQAAGVSSRTLLEALTHENIEARPVWKPLHLQPLFKDVKYYSHKVDQSVSDELFLSGICLPSGSNLSEEELTRVTECIKSTMKVKV